MSHLRFYVINRVHMFTKEPARKRQILDRQREEEIKVYRYN